MVPLTDCPLWEPSVELTAASVLPQAKHVVASGTLAAPHKGQQSGEKFIGSLTMRKYVPSSFDTGIASTKPRCVGRTARERDPKNGGLPAYSGPLYLWRK